MISNGAGSFSFTLQSGVEYVATVARNRVTNVTARLQGQPRPTLPMPRDSVAWVEAKSLLERLL